jgi:hypothetical protein
MVANPIYSLATSSAKNGAYARVGRTNGTWGEVASVKEFARLLLLI